MPFGITQTPNAHTIVRGERMSKMQRKPYSAWRVFWRTVLIMLAGLALMAIGFFGAMFVTQALAV